MYAAFDTAITAWVGPMLRSRRGESDVEVPSYSPGPVGGAIALAIPILDPSMTTDLEARGSSSVSPSARLLIILSAMEGFWLSLPASYWHMGEPLGGCCAAQADADGAEEHHKIQLRAMALIRRSLDCGVIDAEVAAVMASDGKLERLPLPVLLLRLERAQRGALLRDSYPGSVPQAPIATIAAFISIPCRPYGDRTPRRENLNTYLREVGSLAQSCQPELTTRLAWGLRGPNRHITGARGWCLWSLLSVPAFGSG